MTLTALALMGATTCFSALKGAVLVLDKLFQSQFHLQNI